MSRALQAFFLVFLFTLCAFAQRTGGSFGGSRWGSGSSSGSRASTSSYSRPSYRISTPTYSRPTYRAPTSTYSRPTYTRPIFTRPAYRPAPSPVVVHTSSTHVVPVFVPVSTGYTAPVHSSEPVYVAEDADDSVADTITLFVISAIVIALIVAGIAGVFRERRRW